MRKLIAIAICSIPFAVVPAVYAQSSTDGKPKAPDTSPTPHGSMGGTSASSGKHGTAGTTMGEGMKSHGQGKSTGGDGASSSTEASKKIGGEPAEIAPKKATPPGTSANEDKAGNKGTGSK